MKTSIKKRDVKDLVKNYIGKEVVRYDVVQIYYSLEITEEMVEDIFNDEEYKKIETDISLEDFNDKIYNIIENLCWDNDMEEGKWNYLDGGEFDIDNVIRISEDEYADYLLWKRQQKLERICVAE